MAFAATNEPRKTSLFNRFQGILSFKGDIQDAIEDKEEGLFFCGEALPKPVLRRDLEVSPEISVSSRYNHKFRIDEYLENAWEALVNLGYVAKTAFPCRREAIRQILIHPLADFLEAFNDLCPFPFLCPCEPFLKKERGLTHGCFRYKAV